jgi:hypothetical protein
LLVPYWLSGEWWERASAAHLDYLTPVAAGICALSFTYFSAIRGPDENEFRLSLAWAGGIALLPAAVSLAAERWHPGPLWTVELVAWCIALGMPLLLAWILRGSRAKWNAAAIGWTVLLAATTRLPSGNALVYVWCAIGAVGLVAWGIREARPERINIGIAGFAIDVLAYYFSTVMDKLGRSASLILLGLLFLGGGWVLERTRRRLLAQISVGHA